MTAPMARRDESEALQRQAFDWISKLSLDGASERDIAALREWRGRSAAHAEAFSSAARLWRSLDPVLLAARREGKAMPPREGVASAVLGRRALVGGMVGAAAAAAAGLMVVRPPFGLWPSLSELRADYRTGIGKRRSLSVDGTASVELNTATSIALRSEADGETGIVLISGEAAITKSGSTDRLFTVTAGTGRTIAREAVFDVRRDGASVCVTCLSGGLEIGYGGRLLAVGTGQQVTYTAAMLGTPIAVDTAVVAAWRSGMLVFHDQPMAHVIDEVNRYRPGRIILMNVALGRRLVTARFELDQLDDVIMQMSQVFGARVTELPGGIVLVS